MKKKIRIKKIHQFFFNQNKKKTEKTSQIQTRSNLKRSRETK